jgi:hypothetical protein
MTDCCVNWYGGESSLDKSQWAISLHQSTTPCRQLVSREEDARILDREIRNRAWEQLLCERHLVIIAADGQEVAFSDVAPQATGTLEHIEYGSGQLQVPGLRKSTMSSAYIDTVNEICLSDSSYNNDQESTLRNKPLSTFITQTTSSMHCTGAYRLKKTIIKILRCLTAITSRPERLAVGNDIW